MSIQQTGERLEIATQSNLLALKQDLIRAAQTTTWQEGMERDDMDGGRTKVQGVIQHQLDSASAGEINKLVAMRTSEELRRLVSSIVCLKTEAEAARQGQSLLKALYFASIRSRHRSIEKAHATTFRWVLEDSPSGADAPPRSRFRSWLRNETGVFWIQGKPGSGKSTLMKFISGHPDTQLHLRAWAAGKKLAVASFFFWNSGTQLQKSQEGLLRSFLYEILRKIPELIPIAQEAMASCEELHVSEPDSWCLDTLLRMYESVVTQTALPSKFCFFVDGLDEFQDRNRSHADLLRMLRDMKHSDSIKLCVSSRPWTVFGDEFSGNSDCVLKLEDLTRDDITRYVTDKFDGHPQFSALGEIDPAYRNLVDCVVHRAQGVFLWVYLVVKSLLEGLTYHDSLRTLQARLEAFPPDLEAFFQHLVHSVPEVYRTQLAWCLHIASAPPGPVLAMFYSFLLDGEDNAAFLARPSSTPLSAHQVSSRHETLRRRLDGRSRGLLEMVRGDLLESTGRETGYSAFFSCAVGFLHRTVRDFVRTSPEIKAYIDQALIRGRTAHLAGCDSAMALIKAAPIFAKNDPWTAYMLGILSFFVSEVLSSQQPLTAPESLEQTLERAEKVYASALRRQGWQNSAEIASYDICALAAQVGFSSYLENHWPNDDFEGLTKTRSRRPLLDYALNPADASHPISPDVVRFLLAHGAKPMDTYMGQSVWSRFVLTLPSRVDGNDGEAVREVVGVLIRCGGAKISGSVCLQTLQTDEMFSRFPELPETSHDFGRQRDTAISSLAFGERMRSTEGESRPKTIERIFRSAYKPAEFAFLEALEKEAKTSKASPSARRSMGSLLGGKGAKVRHPREAAASPPRPLPQPPHSAEPVEGGASGTHVPESRRRPALKRLFKRSSLW